MTNLKEPTNMLEGLLKQMIELEASDLHLVHNNPIAFRISKRMVKTKIYIKGQDIFKMLVEAKAIDDYHINSFHEDKAANFAVSYSGVRFRGNLVQVRGNYSCVLRRLSDKAIPLSEIGLPKQVIDAIKKDTGIILITGPTGSGKTTTLTSLIDYINETKDVHIATAEDPVEFVHQPKRSVVTQREVGVDTPSFAQALKDVLRRDPDVILIGELRDIETIENALVAASTGHLVFCTLHTNSCALSIDRFVNVFPPMLQNNVRSQLADNLRMIVNQRLVPKIGGGVTPAYEVMFPNRAIKRAIKAGDVERIEELMKEGEKDGNILLEDAILKLKESGKVQDE